MNHRLRFAFATAVIPMVAGCAGIDYPPFFAPDQPRPGLEALAIAPPPPPPPAPEPTRPLREKPAEIPFPPAELTATDAERLLAGDPMALRFLAARRLAAEGLAPVDEVRTRKDVNMGALLPLTTREGPAPELELPLPPLAAVLKRFEHLDDPKAKGSPDARANEQAFLLDQVLPARPESRLVLAPHDKASARAVLQRLGRLERAGLISADEREREARAVETLMASLPEILLPPQPPEPVATAKKGRGGVTGTGSAAATRRLPGGVTGKLEVIPSPLSLEPPKMTADFKGEAGVHLLSMASATHGAKAWEALSNQFKQELAGLSFTVQRADLGELGVTYRLIAGPMDPGAAERLCSVIRQKGQACMPTPYPQIAAPAASAAPIAPAASAAPIAPAAPAAPIAQ